MKLEKKIALVIVFFVIILFAVLHFRNSGSFIYHGKNGDFKFDVSKIEKINIYSPHVNYNGKEYVYAFRNKPQKLESLEFDQKVIDNLNRPDGLVDVYITKDINLSELTNASVSLVTAPMASILGKADYGIYKKNVRVAFTQFHAGQPTAPAVDCSTVNLNGNVNRTSAVIFLKLGEQNRVYSDGECIVIEGKNTDGLIKAGEKFAYSLIGVF